MKTKLMILCLFIVSLLFMTCKPKETRAPIIPLENFFKNPEKTAYQISPDGKYFSYLAPVNKRMNVFIQEVGKDTALQITHETDRDIAWYFWASNQRVLYQKDIGGNENFRLFGVNLDGTNLVCFTPFEGVRTEVIDDLPDIDDEVIIQMNKRNPEIFDPYRLNIQTGEMKMLAKKAVQKPDTLKPFTSEDTSRIIKALMTSRKPPSVNSVSGRVKKTRTGRMKALAMPSISADTSSACLVEKEMPLKMAPATHRASVMTPQCSRNCVRGYVMMKFYGL